MGSVLCIRMAQACRQPQMPSSSSRAVCCATETSVLAVTAPLAATAGRPMPAGRGGLGSCERKKSQCLPTPQQLRAGHPKSTQGPAPPVEGNGTWEREISGVVKALHAGHGRPREEALAGADGRAVRATVPAQEARVREWRPHERHLHPLVNVGDQPAHRCRWIGGARRPGKPASGRFRHGVQGAGRGPAMQHAFKQMHAAAHRPTALGCAPP